MPIALLDQVTNSHILAVEVEYFAVLCAKIARLDPRPIPEEREGRKTAKKASGVLNFTIREFLSVVVRGSSFVVIRVPLDRALGGRPLRKRRTERDFGEKGLNLVATSVMNLICMVAVVEMNRERGIFVLQKSRAPGESSRQFEGG